MHVATGALLYLACSKHEAPVQKPTADTPVSTASAAALASVPTEVPSVAATASIVDLPDDPKASFLENRLRHAKAGMTELVSLRVWHCGPSCTCPQPCIETVGEEIGAKWIDLVDASGKPVPLADWSNADVVGQFTGRIRKAKGPSPEEHELAELRITGAPTLLGTAMAPAFDDAHAKVVLSGAAAARTVTPVKDDRPYLVVAGTVALGGGQRADADAQKMLKKVQDAGYSDAERQDSRAYAGLACCFDVIVAGRFADAKSADVRKAELGKKGISAYVKKGF